MAKFDCVIRRLIYETVFDYVCLEDGVEYYITKNYAFNDSLVVYEYSKTCSFFRKLFKALIEISPFSPPFYYFNCHFCKVINNEYRCKGGYSADELVDAIVSIGGLTFEDYRECFNVPIGCNRFDFVSVLKEIKKILGGKDV